MRKRYYGGCDVGSTTGKAVIIDESAHVVASALVPSTLDPETTSRQALDQACASLSDLSRADKLSSLVGTGYGRTEVPFADENVSEITCHAVGAHACDPGVRTIVDIGGQDVKAIALNRDGTVREFAMNDKCAAGTGRFFEAMGRIFDVSLERFSSLSLEATKVVPITTQCSVFAETEVVSLISKRVAPANIAAGVQAAVAKRVFTLVRRVGVEPKLVITGGCAKNAGLAAAVSKLLRIEPDTLTLDAQLMGAYGAALLAKRRLDR